MDKFKKILHHLLFPPVIIIVLLVLVSAVSLAYVFGSGLDNSVLAYASYVISAYALTAVCCRIPDIIKFIKKSLNNNYHTRRFISEADLRAKISLYSGLCLNLLYSVFKLASGIMYRSVWFGAEAVYYIVLSITRSVLVSHDRKSKDNLSDKWRSFSICGRLMLLLNFAMTGIAVQIIWQNKSYSYNELMIYATAGYTFYRLTMAIINVVKFSKNSDPILAASKWINLSAALMSLFTLQTAMLSQFGSGEEAFTQTLNAFSGGAVCLAAICIAIYMIRKAKKH